jgi:hypothetical protein
VRTEETTRDSRNPNIIQTTGEVWASGNLLEVLRDAVDDKRLKLLSWRDNRAQISPEVVLSGQRYVPANTARVAFRWLPSKPVPYGSTQQLFNDIRAFLQKFSGLAEETASLLTFFCLSSWFVDCVRMAPCVLVYGPPLNAIGLEQLLACVCYHPVLLSSSAQLSSDRWIATRFLACADSKFDRLLGLLQFPDFRAAGPEHSRAPGATAAYLADEELQSPFVDSCICLPLAPGNWLFSRHEENLAAGEIRNLQNRLLDFRLTNFENVKQSKFDVPEFPSAIRELARSLGAPLVDAPDLQALLRERLHPVAESLCDNVDELESAVVEALLICCHQRMESVHVAQIRDRVRIILTGQGEASDLSNRAIGARLKKLGLPTVRLDARGRGIRLMRSECMLVHKLARLYRVDFAVERSEACPCCHPIDKEECT